MADLRMTLRNIIASSPSKLKVYQLNENYKSIAGHNIPFEKYGYQNLVEFLQDMSEVLTLDGNDIFSIVGIHKAKQKKKRMKAKRKMSVDSG